MKTKPAVLKYEEIWMLMVTIKTKTPNLLSRVSSLRNVVTIPG